MLPNPAHIIRSIPGFLCANPTDLTQAFPHGGTALGNVRTVVWQPNVKFWIENAEEFGNIAIDLGISEEVPMLSLVYRGWDKDAVTGAFDDTIDGANTGRPVVRGRVTNEETLPGTAIGPRRAVTLYWSPRARQLQGLIIYRAIPVPFPEAETWGLGLSGDAGIPARWLVAAPDKGNTYDIGLRADLAPLLTEFRS